MNAGAARLSALLARRLLQGFASERKRAREREAAGHTIETALRRFGLANNAQPSQIRGGSGAYPADAGLGSGPIKYLADQVIR
jgi:type II secretory pathway pseudopilin PulG